MFLCNDPSSAASEARETFCLMHSDLLTRVSSRVVMQKHLSKNNKHKVAIVTGGGSGHEPFGAAFVGRGMVTASVVGDLFSAAPTRSVELAINTCLASGYESVLLIAHNYTGDRMTFGLAQRRCSKTTIFFVADDCTTKALRIGPRGLAGDLLFYKIAGAMTEKGSTLDFIKEEMESLQPRIQTMGVCFQTCTLPGKNGRILEIDGGYAELGLGVHGEAGVEKIKVSSCDDLVSRMLSKVVDGLNDSQQKLAFDRLVLLVNNLGAMSHLEMSLITRSALHFFVTKYSVRPVRLYVGTYVTSLDTKGFSISVFLANSDAELEYLDCETDALVWSRSCNLPPLEILASKPEDEHHEELTNELQMPKISDKIAETVNRVCHRILRMSDRLNVLDGGGMGDSDTGSTLAKMANKLLADIDATCPDPSLSTSLECTMNFLYYASRVAESEMGGTSGGLYAFGLQTAGDAVKRYVDGENKGSEDNSLDLWRDVVHSVLWAVQFLGGAQPGDRSLVDPLDAIVNVIDSAKTARASSLKSILQDSVVAGVNAADATAEMRARVGRAAAARDFTTKQPDAGATALAAVWSELVASTYSK